MLKKDDKVIDKQEIEYNLKVGYPEFISKIIDSENKLIDIILDLAVRFPLWIENNDLRIGVYDRYISQLVPSRISLQLISDFANKNEWSTDYVNRFQPKRIPLQPNGYIYLKELDLSLRFSHYQQVFSQFESTIKNLIYFFKRHNKTASDKWFNFITTNLKIRTDKDEFLNLIRETRNSIHNNGIYISKDCKPLVFNIKEHVFEFNHEKTINLDWNDVIFLTNEIVDFTYEMLNSEIILEFSSIIDMTKQE